MPKLDPIFIATKFHERFQNQFVFYKGDFYRYLHTEGYYLRLAQKEFEAQVMRFLHANETLSGMNTTRTQVRDVIANLEAIYFIANRTTVPSWLNKKQEHLKNRFINAKNGILELSFSDGLAQANLIPHSVEYFNLGNLGFDYVAEADCPKWKSFLIEMIPDEETRTFLQEWFGYNLVFDTTKEKFVILYGMGANGKTVIVTVLKTLVGKPLLSTVPLEVFKLERTFPMAEMHGKLANVVAEIGEIDRDTDALLKMVVSGEEITVERKFKDPFTAKMTARLTFATNVFPKFRDTSSALPRRLVLISLDKQILNETEQKKEFLDPNYWIESGEMAGILNWAIEGLARLEHQGHFTVPKKSREDVERHFVDLNPAKAFLMENYESTDKAIELLPSQIYSEYGSWCSARGHKPLNLPNFSKEILRAFPLASQEKNAVRRNGARVRPIKGIQKVANITDGEAEVFSIIGQ